MAALSLRYPGCKSLFIRGLRFRSSLLVAQAFGRGFVRWPVPDADASRRKRGKKLLAGINLQQV